MENKKPFFRERTAAEIRSMNCRRTGSARELVERIMELNPKSDSLCLMFGLTPREFGTKDSTRASRRNLKHGKYASINQPYSVEDALKEGRIPLALRQEALDRLIRIPQEGNFCLGYSFRPIIGSNKTRVFVPFWAIMEGCRRDTYDLKVCKSMSDKLDVGSKVIPYVDANRVESEGGTVLVRVPSSSKGEKSYLVRWNHVAVKDNPQKRVICWGTVPNFVVSGEDELANAEPMHKMYNIRYTCREDREGSQFNMIYPQDIESHQAMIRCFMGHHNIIPLERSQYAIPSVEAAEFWTKLCNNVLVEDLTLKDKSKKDSYRKLHIDEKCMLQARQVGVLGAQRTMYWDAERDGRIKDYNWEI